MKLTNSFNRIMEVVRDSLQYSIFEAMYLVGLVVDLWIGEGLSTWYLWLGFVLAALWTVISSSNEARDTAKDMILSREMFMSDFIMSSAILSLIAIIMHGESWWFPAMILLAAGQNLRYIYLSSNWLLEERRERRRKERHSDDHMP